VANDHWFVTHPEQVAGDDFAWLSAAWYWLQPHPHDGLTFLNEAADAGNLLTATRMVNGGEHGLATRRFHFNKASDLGDELMTPVGPGDPNWSDVMTRDELNDLIDNRLRALMLGDDDLHVHKPRIFGKHGRGLNGRLREHGTRLQALEDAAQHPTPAR
jgi:hypothetical protein